jgi:hypothetical protein
LEPIQMEVVSPLKTAKEKKEEKKTWFRQFNGCKVVGFRVGWLKTSCLNFDDYLKIIFKKTTND